jgi:predicted SnoaL-like aldol condensation-catalyzing enzyme
MNRKERAAAFLKMAGLGNAKAAYEQFIAPNFIHHNQYFKGDRQSLMDAMDAAHRKSPNKVIDIKQVFEDGNTVITHSRVVRENPNEPDVAVVHIFRFEGDKVAELWDVGQPLNRDSANENGAF